VVQDPWVQLRDGLDCTKQQPTSVPTLSDTGPGIAEEHQSRIFEQFHQVDSSNTKAKAGTGLGLAIAKQIVEMHGGHICVESTLGKGSTFLMELPTRAKFHNRAL
jgi:signal transduction histidine kinase